MAVIGFVFFFSFALLFIAPDNSQQNAKTDLGIIDNSTGWNMYRDVFVFGVFFSIQVDQ